MRNDAANTIYIILQQISFLISNLGPKARHYSLLISHFSFLISHSSFLIPHSSFINVIYVDIACSISLIRIYSSAL